MTGYAAVIGGINLDICGTAETMMLPGDSNPGAVSEALGGVGRNIAENLVRLGCPVRMLTLLGQDSAGEKALAHCRSLSIDLSLSELLPDARTGTYLYLNDSDGELYAAVADMAIYERITPAWLAGRLECINGAAFAVVDANLPEESITWLAEHCTVPLIGDPVSVKKAVRMRAGMSRFAMIKPNRAEAQLLSRVPVHGTDGLAEAAQVMLRDGVGCVMISLGPDGVYYADGKSAGIQPCLDVSAVSTSGCGDAFLAAAAIGLAEGAPVHRIAEMGQAAAALTARCQGPVNPEISLPAVQALLRRE